MKKHLPLLRRLVGACAMLTLALGGVAHAVPTPARPRHCGKWCHAPGRGRPLSDRTISSTPVIKLPLPGRVPASGTQLLLRNSKCELLDLSGSEVSF